MRKKFDKFDLASLCINIYYIILQHSSQLRSKFRLGAQSRPNEGITKAGKTKATATWVAFSDYILCCVSFNVIYLYALRAHYVEQPCLVTIVSYGHQSSYKDFFQLACKHTLVHYPNCVVLTNSNRSQCAYLPRI